MLKEKTKKKFKFVVLLFCFSLVAFGLLGLAARAADNVITKAPPSYWPIVPCGLHQQPKASGQNADAQGLLKKEVWDYTQDCNQCLLIVLFVNLINLLMRGLVPILGTFFFLLGGFFILAGADKPGRIGDGKKIMWSTAIGIAIIYGSFMVTNFILGSLASQEFLASIHWSPAGITISCKVSSLKDIVDNTSPGLGGVGVTGSGGGGTGGTGGTGGGGTGTTSHYKCVSNQCSATTDTGTGTYSESTCGGTCKPVEVGVCGNFNAVCAASTCPGLIKDAGITGGQSSWAYLIPSVAASHPVPGADTTKLLTAIMKIESNGKLSAQSPSVPPSCGLMQMKEDTAALFKTQCGISNPTTCAWLEGKALHPGETLETVAKADICLAAEYLKSMAVSSCYKGQLSDLAAGYNGGGGCNATQKDSSGKLLDNALALSNSCSSASTATDKMATDCYGRPTLRYECVYEDLAHTSCNIGFRETRNYVQAFNACYK